MKVVDVVAGVITDARGRILLARRTEGRDLAGLWEFPGGKREPGETPEAALVRELHEELGIVAHVGDHLITVPQRYPDKRLRLDVRHVTRWTGVPRGREGQALAWVPPHKLPSYAMPPADIPVVAALLQPDRYAITPGLADLPPCRSGYSRDHARGEAIASPAAPATADPDAAATAWLGLQFGAQATVFVVVAGVGCYAVHLYRARNQGAQMAPIDAGMPASFESWVDAPARLARVRYRGASWDARVEGGEALEAGATVYVLAADGNTLKVAKNRPT